jgi:hypothetical protein
MKPKKLPPTQPLQATQHYPFRHQIKASDGSGKVDVEGKRPRWLKATRRGGNLRISGTPRKAGEYELTVVEKRTGEKRVSKVTIRVDPGLSMWSRPLWHVLTGKRPAPPPKGS